MHKLAAKIRKKDNAIFFKPKSPIFFIKIKNRAQNVIAPDKEVARAMPAIFKGKISKAMKTIFKTSVTAAILVGVTVSFKLKKHACNIFVPP